MRVSDTNFYGTYPPKGYRIPGADVNGFKPGHTDKNERVKRALVEFYEDFFSTVKEI